MNGDANFRPMIGPPLIANSPAANDAVFKKFLFELEVFAVATFKVKAGVPCRLSHQFPFPRLQPNITSPSQENLSGANLVLPQLSEVPTVDDPVK